MRIGLVLGVYIHPQFFFTRGHHIDINSDRISHQVCHGLLGNSEEFICAVVDFVRDSTMNRCVFCFHINLVCSWAR